MPKATAPELIDKKRLNQALTSDEIRWLIDTFTAGEVTDAQMSAFAMAVMFQGMNAEETAALTDAMLQSGSQLEHTPGSPIVDKHSTGGVGDKVSLILAPLLACDDLRVPMISGRGLGLTGGTLDKLESIPGFRTDLSLNEISQQLDTVGVVITGQTAELCPADRKLYALRDATATVASQPLIVASIMSKKLAESLDRLVLDVKYGSGAFMKTEEDAQSLADAMAETGERMGVRTRCLLTPMDAPLGTSVGNTVEVQESLLILSGGGSDAIRELVLDLAEEVSDAGRGQLERWLTDGAASEKFGEMVNAQGGDLNAFAKEPAEVVLEHRTDRSGTVIGLDAAKVGSAACAILGAGRTHPDQKIDHRNGFDSLTSVGASVDNGDLLARIHAPSQEAAEAASRALDDAYQIQ